MVIEWLIIIAIIGLLGAIAIPNFITSRQINAFQKALTTKIPSCTGSLVDVANSFGNLPAASGFGYGDLLLRDHKIYGEDTISTNIELRLLYSNEIVSLTGPQGSYRPACLRELISFGKSRQYGWLPKNVPAVIAMGTFRTDSTNGSTYPIIMARGGHHLAFAPSSRWPSNAVFAVVKKN